MGNGFDQTTARRRARELGGIAVSARPRSGDSDGWHIGGWGQPGDVWIVVTPDWTVLLDDGDGPPETVDVPLDTGDIKTLELLEEKGERPTSEVHGRSSERVKHLALAGLIDLDGAKMHITATGRLALAQYRAG